MKFLYSLKGIVYTIASVFACERKSGSHRPCLLALLC
jgi:hypothetical protein